MATITLYLRGGGSPRELMISKRRFSIGRRRENDIAIDDPAVSSEHAVIVSDDADPYIEDLESTNGTRVNGQPVQKHFLRDGDVIQITLHHFVYSCAPDKA